MLDYLLRRAPAPGSSRFGCKIDGPPLKFFDWLWGPLLAATNKRLAKSNKSCTWSEATMQRRLQIACATPVACLGLAACAFGAVG